MKTYKYLIAEHCKDGYYLFNTVAAISTIDARKYRDYVFGYDITHDKIKHVYIFPKMVHLCLSTIHISEVEYYRLKYTKSLKIKKTPANIRTAQNAIKANNLFIKQLNEYFSSIYKSHTRARKACCNEDCIIFAYFKSKTDYKYAVCKLCLDINGDYNLLYQRELITFKDD